MTKDKILYLVDSIIVYDAVNECNFYTDVRDNKEIIELAKELIDLVFITTIKIEYIPYDICMTKESNRYKIRGYIDIFAYIKFIVENLK